jgi:hypothetical protein
VEELITVIVPIYNVEDFIDMCLESLSKQTYKHFEVLMVNDGSTDNSGIICKEYADRDSRFQYFEKENGGLSDARNFGLEHSKGDYITFVDSDDWVSDTYLFDLYEALTRENADISLASYAKYNVAEAMYYFHVSEDNYYERIFSSEELIRELPNLELAELSYYTSWGKLFRRTLFEHVQFPKGKLIEDTRTNIKLFLESSKIIYINKGLYFYCIREGSIIQSVTENLLEDVLDTLVERICIVSMKGLYSDLYKNTLLSHLESRCSQARNSGLEGSEIYRRYIEMIHLIK